MRKVMGRIKRGLLALFVVVLSFVAVEATPALAQTNVGISKGLRGLGDDGDTCTALNRETESTNDRID